MNQDFERNQEPDAIVIFSAGIVPDGKGGWKSTTYDDCDAFGTLGGRDRIEAGAILAKIFPNASVVTTSHTMGQDRISLAKVYASELSGLGVSPERMIEEESSTTTRSAVEAALRLAKERGWKCLLFVSSAFHIPRVRAFFEAARFPMSAEFIDSESVLSVHQPDFRERFVKIRESEAYKRRLKSEDKGLQDLKKGQYVAAPAKDKKERLM